MYTKFISSSNIDKCPNCDVGILIEKTGAYGKFKACNNYPECKYIAKKEKPPQATTSEKCPQCKTGDMVIKPSKFGEMKACNQYPKCKYIEQKPKTDKPQADASGEICPECSSPMLKRKSKDGTKEFLGCSAFPKCKHMKW